MREEIVRRPCQQTAGAAWGETCPISTEGWTRRVHFVREGGGGGGVADGRLGRPCVPGDPPPRSLNPRPRVSGRSERRPRAPPARPEPAPPRGAAGHVL